MISKSLSKILIAVSVFLSGSCSHSTPHSEVINKSSRVADPGNFEFSKSLLLVSLDGFRPDYLTPQNTPTLWQISKEGALAENGMLPSFPTLTFPNHYSLVTGLHPENHGIIANEMKDPDIADRFSLGNRLVTNDPRWWIGEPIWVTAQKQGLKSATMFWPGSEAEIHGVRPTYFVPYDQQMPAAKRVEQFLSWLDLEASARANFFTLYFEEVDSIGHKFGPKSPEILQALRNVDSAMALLVQGLKDRNLWGKMNLIVSSDHGMVEIENQKRIDLQEIFKIFPNVETIGGGALMGAFSKNIKELAALKANLKNASPHIDVYLKNEIPSHFHYQKSARIPDLLIVAKEGAYIQMKPVIASAGGTHGYDHRLKSMRALFLAHGPAFQQSLFKNEFSNRDVYPLMCKILQIKAQKHDGILKNIDSILR